MLPMLFSICSLTVVASTKPLLRNKILETSQEPSLPSTSVEIDHLGNLLLPGEHRFQQFREELAGAPSNVPSIGLESLNSNLFRDLDQTSREHNHNTACDVCAGPQWLFIISTGRAGSTSILQMLNAIPGFHIAGETRKGRDRGVFPILRELYMTTKNVGFQSRQGIMAHSAISEEKVLCTLQEYVKNLVGEYDRDTTNTIGTKELIDIKDINNRDTLDFLGRLFPCARYIINTRRNISAQSQSAYHKVDHSVNLLQQATQMLAEWRQSNQASSFPMVLEDFSADLFNNLLTWLHVENCRFSWVVHSNAEGSYVDDPKKPSCNGAGGLPSMQSEGAGGLPTMHTARNKEAE